MPHPNIKDKELNYSDMLHAHYAETHGLKHVTLDVIKTERSEEAKAVLPNKEAQKEQKVSADVA